MIDESLYPVTSGQVLIKKRNEYSIVKDVKTGEVGRANEDLRDLLLLCDGTRTVAQIAETLFEDFEEPHKEVKKKVAKSIEFLKDLDFIQLAETPEYTPLHIRDSDMEWPLDMAYLEVTNRCNLKCIHCYKTAGNPLPEELSTKEWVSVIDELSKLGVLTLAITGGEPLLREDIAEILKHAAKNVVGVTVFTNGTVITEEMVDVLKGVTPEKIMISLDGASKTTHERIRGKNTFDRTVRSIALLTENGLKVRSNTVVYTENIGELDDLIKLLLDLGVSEMIFDRFMDAGRGKENEELIPPLEMGEIAAQKCHTLEQEAPQRFELRFTPEVQESDSPFSFCGIGTSMVAVKANGDLCLCPVLSGPESTAGNIKDTPLKELWMDSEIFQPFRECTLDDIVCKICSHKLECRGGCKARVLQHYKKVCMPDPWMCAVRGQKWPQQ